MKKENVLFLLIVFIFVIFLSQNVLGTDYCGAGTTAGNNCGCGYTVTGDVVLAGDIGGIEGCVHSGLIVGSSGITIDCNGKKIIGDGPGPDYGIYADSKSDITIKNCVISDFWRIIGIVSGSDNVLIQNNTLDGASSGGDGIYFKGSSDNAIIRLNKIINVQNYGINIADPVGTLIEYNQISYSREKQGIWVHGDADNTIIKNNVIHNNAYQGILLDSGLSDLIGNHVCNNGVNEDIHAVSGTLRICVNNMFKYDAYSPGGTSICTTARYDCQSCISPCQLNVNGVNVCSVLCNSSGFNFPQQLGSYYLIGQGWFSSCNLMPLSQQYDGINCSGKEQTYTETNNGVLYDCSGCGGAHRVACTISSVVVAPNPLDCPLDNNGVYNCGISNKIKVNVSLNLANCNSYLNIPKKISLQLKSKTSTGSSVSVSSNPGGSCQNKPNGLVECNFSANLSVFSQSELNKLFNTSGQYPNPWNVSSVKLYNASGSTPRLIDSFTGTNLLYQNNRVRFVGQQQSTGCEIYNAKVKTDYCSGATDNYGKKKCFVGDKININVTLNQECIRLGLYNDGGLKMIGYQLSASGEPIDNPPSIIINASEDKYLASLGDLRTFSANWTIRDVPAEYLGKTFKGEEVEAYNSSDFASENWLGSLDGNFGNFTIEQPSGCNIIDVEITDYCGSNGCSNGEKIGMNVSVQDSSKCLNVNKLKIDATSPPPQSDVCTGATLTNSTPIQKSGNNYTANWSVSVPDGCLGKTMYASRASIYNGSNNLIATLSAGFQENFGSFRFAGTQPQPLPMQAIIVHPREGDSNIYNVGETIWLNESSIGQIETWSWFYQKIGETSWTLIDSFTQSSLPPAPNTTITFAAATPGSYYINLTVSNSTPMRDSDIVTIHLRQPGWPLAIISEPLRDAILKNSIYSGRSAVGVPQSAWSQPGFVFFNGSLTNDSNNPLGDFNMTWIFNATDKKSGFYNQTNVTYKIYSPASLYAGRILTIELNASDGHNSTIDRVNFSLAYCQSGSQKVFAGGCIGIKYCNESKCQGNVCELVDNCVKCQYCLNPPYCNPATGTCIANSGADDCADRMSDTSCQNPNSQRGCYWNYSGQLGNHCKYCSPTPPGPVSCSDYRYGPACEKDVYGCGLGSSGAGTQDCNRVKSINGTLYYLANCHCSWNGSACGLNITYIPSGGGGNGGDEYSCTYSINSSGCASCQVGAYDGRWVNYTKISGPAENCTDTANCIRCSITSERLPFFVPWQILIVLFLIGVYYFIFNKKARIINKK